MNESKNRQKPVEFLAQFPSNLHTTLQADLKNVSEWLRCKPQDLRLRLTNLPAERFYQMAQDMLGTYEEFPQDEARTRKILRAIQSGEPVLPVFIEEGDEHHFIMEGRHRIVAFIQSGIAEISVAFVGQDHEIKFDFEL